jgi:hypothetical protein
MVNDNNYPADIPKTYTVSYHEADQNLELSRQ